MKRIPILLLMFFFSMSFWRLASAQPPLWVPGSYPHISDALADADSGEVIAFDGDHDETGMVTINESVTIANLLGKSVSITAGASNPYALRINSDDAKVDGITLRAGSSPTGIVDINGKSEVSHCVLEDNGYTVSGRGAELEAGSKLTSCTMNLTGGRPRAVFIGGSSSSDPALVQGNTFNLLVTSAGSGDVGIYGVPGSDYAIVDGNQLLFTSSGGYLGNGVSLNGHDWEITNNVISTASKGIENSADGTQIEGNVIAECTYGVWIASGDSYVSAENNTIVRNTRSSSTYGIWTDVGTGTVYSFQHNLIKNLGTGLHFGSDVQGGWTVYHNAYWTDSGGCGTGSNRTLTSTQLATNLEPLFCNEHEAPVGKYTQKMDSATAPGNNGWGDLVGAYDVECAWGELARNTTLPEDATVTVLEDVTIPDGKSLTLEPRSTLQFDGDDDSNGGLDILENELIVDDGGTLTIAGTSGNAVTLTSSAPNLEEGDWWGVGVEEGGTANIEYASVTYSQLGVSYRSTTDGSVSYSSFANNESADICAGVGNHTMSATIDHNVITVGGGRGILLESFLGGLTVEANTITGNSSSLYGIEFGSMSSGEKPDLIGNAISGVTTGSGIYLAEAEPTLKENTVSGCKYGLHAIGGEAKIGLASDSSSDNYIRDNTTTGILVYGGSPVVRNNQITGNEYGVVARYGGDPDLGTGSSQQGKNTFNGNGTYCIWNRNSTGTVHAEGNYFGACNPDPGICWFGDVDTDNYLCSAPAGTGFEAEIGEAPGQVTEPVVHGLYPNPMQGSGRIAFSLPTGSDRVNVRVYDLSGRVVRDFGDLAAKVGAQDVLWDGRDALGAPVGNGIYFIKVAVSGRPAGVVKALVVR